MVLGKKVVIFDWEWGRNLAPRYGQKIPWVRMGLKSTVNEGLVCP